MNPPTWLGLLLVAVIPVAPLIANDETTAAPDLRTPATPRINGPTIFGVRPGSRLLHTVPITSHDVVLYRVSPTLGS